MIQADPDGFLYETTEKVASNLKKNLNKIRTAVKS